MARTRIDVQNGNDELSFDGGLVTIGGRTGVDVLLRDPMVADRHCVITYEDGFVVRDVGSVVGTYVDGDRVIASTALSDGATIVIGTTRVAVSVGVDDGVATLSLATDPQSFWWQKAGKGAFGNDPDQLVYSETRFGRFPALRLGNRVALIAGAVLLVAATFLSAVMEPLADAGPLQPSHAVVTSAAPDDASIHAGIRRCVELAGEQGCNVCHATGDGAPERKCAQCHGLPGEMAHEASRRHPYHGGAVADQQFCVVCHTDHAGKAVRKPASDALVGNCAACHDEGDGNFDRERLIQRAPINVAAQQPTAFEALRFPHDRHVDFDCAVCHQLDPERVAARAGGLPDDPARHDFTSVPYAVCASCHVADAEPVQMTAAQQSEWRAVDHQWNVAWHGSAADGGQRCLQCHTSRRIDDASVYGPDLETVERGDWSAAQYRQQRALYTTASRSHAQQFADHAEGKACTTCHLDGKITQPVDDRQRARTFWHGLHVAAGALAPADDRAAAVSLDGEQGCVSCHGDLAGDAELTPLAAGPYHWPQDSEAQAACSTCHREGQAALQLTAMAASANVDARAVPDFPHDVHVGSGSFGLEGSLAKGCFACHEFAEPIAGEPFSQVPTTLAAARDCTSCHGGHDDVGGGDCQQCHPKVEGQSNAFLAHARVTDPPWPTRPWPAPNGFSHLSDGHKDEDCSSCHGGGSIAEAGTLADLRVPDERQQSCRACHLDKQFHWR